MIQSRKKNIRYIGSTEKTLEKRMTWHRSSSNNTSSHLVLVEEDYKIILLEEGYFSDKAALKKREREWYDKLPCVNKYRPYITDEERKEIWMKSRIKSREFVVCEVCCSIIQIREKARHERTDKHQLELNYLL